MAGVKWRASRWKERGTGHGELSVHTVIIDQTFHISHDFRVSTMDRLSHGRERLDFIPFFVRSSELGIQNKGNCQQALVET